MIESVSLNQQPTHNMAQQEIYDVAVIGLGALGSAAAYFAARKGVKVIAFEQFELGHVKGASHDTSRIIRTSYEAPEYVAFAKSAYKDWAIIEEESRQKLITITGGIVFLPNGKTVPAPDKWSNGIPTVADWAKGLEANSIPYEHLTNKQANERWPVLSLEDNYSVIYTEDTGIVHAAKSVTACQFLARMYGVNMLERTKVRRVIPNGTESGENIIDTSRGLFKARKIILAADAWINDLLNPLGLEIPVRISQEQVTYFKPANPAAYEPHRLPTWLWVGEQWMYGFPCYGEPTIKAGMDNNHQYCTGDTRTFVPNPQKITELADRLQKFLPDQGRTELRTVTCLYTMTAEREFALGPLKDYKDIIVTLGSAHGFKFASAFGRVAAELAIDGKTNENIARWCPDNLTVPVRREIGEYNRVAHDQFLMLTSSSKPGQVISDDR